MGLILSLLEAILRFSIPTRDGRLQFSIFSIKLVGSREGRSEVQQ